MTDLKIIEEAFPLQGDFAQDAKYTWPSRWEAVKNDLAHVPEVAPLPSDAPRRAVTLDLSLQADSRQAMVYALDNISRLVAGQQMTRGCSGDYDSGYTYTYAERDGPNHDEYAQQLKDWLAARSPQTPTK